MMSSRSSLDDGDAGEPAAQEQRHRLAQRLAALDEDQVGARHHHLAHEGVAELEDRVDHLRARPTRSGWTPRPGRPSRAARPRRRTVPREKPLPGVSALPTRISSLRQRPEHARDGEHDAGGAERDPLGVLPAEGARADADQHEEHHEHDPDGREHRGPAVGAEDVEHDHRGQHDRRRLGERCAANSTTLRCARRVVEQPHAAARRRAGARARARRRGRARRSRAPPRRRSARPRRRRARRPPGTGPDCRPVMSAQAPRGRRRVVAAQPLGEQSRLEVEHLAVLVGLGVVVAEQVQDAVHGQQVELVVGARGRRSSPAARPPPGRARGRRGRPPRAPR